MKALLGGVIVCWFFATSAVATDFYVDPVNGKANGTGTREAPWQSLQQVFDKGLVRTQQWESLPPKAHTKLVERNPQGVVQPGDTLWLMSGNHGSLAIRGYYNEQPITLAAAKGQSPTLRSISIVGSSNWVLKGLTLRPDLKDPKRARQLIALRSHGHHGPVHDVVVEDCDLASTEDVSNWSIEDWNTLPASGMQVDGTRMTIRHNKVRNINFGISVDASHSLVEDNLVENFAGDGLRGLGDYTVFQYNTVKNCYDVNDNHDDGFQSWSQGAKGSGSGKVVGLVLRGNTIINYEDPNQPFRGPLQGIGCFDGMYVDWVIENNVIIVDHWHGITLMGATNNCRIINNTVADESPGRPGPAWIRIDNHKKGTPSAGNIVRNNLTADLSVADRQANQVDHNLIVKDLPQQVVDLPGFDLRLKPDSTAIDAGTSELAPELDRDRQPRPQGTGIDVGAYEYKD